MRLLRTDTDELYLEDIEDDDTEYAILSHRWFKDKEEITYRDLLLGTERAVLEKKRGWYKLEQCRKQAVEDGLQYVWLDTCCIDKSSSQELTESINSMYRWYQKAAVCYVYLHDMPDPELEAAADVVSDATDQVAGAQDTEITDAADRDSATDVSVISMPRQHSKTAIVVDGQNTGPEEIELEAMPHSIDAPRLPVAPASTGGERHPMEDCEWFQRGWTLQEMLAPPKLHFYSKSWFFLGNLLQLADTVTEITRVHRAALTKERTVYSYSIAQKMSWAANRRTTKIEDRAYSLLGLMDVNMGIIYGEGSRAFRRLQDKLLRKSNNQSIFVFEHNRPPFEGAGSTWETNNSRTGVLLADSPDAFEHSWDIIDRPFGLASPIDFRNEGIAHHQVFDNVLKITMFLLNVDRRTLKRVKKGKTYKTLFEAVLSCGLESDPTKLIAMGLTSSPRGEAFEVKSLRSLDLSKARRHQCPPVTISVAKDWPERGSGHRWGYAHDAKILMCRCTTEGEAMSVLESSNVDLLGDGRDDGGLTIRYTHLDSWVTVVLLSSKPPRTVLQIHRNPHDCLKFRVRFDRQAIHLAPFDRFDIPIFDGGHSIAFKRHHNSVIVAKTYINYFGGLHAHATKITLLEVTTTSILGAWGHFTLWLIRFLVEALTTLAIYVALIILALLPLLLVTGVPIITIFTLEDESIIHLSEKALHITLGLCIGVGVSAYYLLLYHFWRTRRHRRRR